MNGVIIVNSHNSASNDTDYRSLSPQDLEPTYFVLGTLSDYLGRFAYIERKDQVDRYALSEKPLMDFLTEFISTKLNITIDTTIETSGNGIMYSDTLAGILNGFYGQDDKLMNKKFETNHQIYSFLTGVHYRFGEKLDSSIYEIRLINSPKHQNCYDLLKQTGCKKIFYSFLGNIPSSHILYFEPTDELKRYLDIIESEKEKSHKSLLLLISEWQNKKIKEVENDFIEYREMRLDKIKKAFSSN